MSILRPEKEIECSLCQSTDLNRLQHQHWPQKYFWHCQNCDFIFLPESIHVTSEEEKYRYQQHNNTLDPGYQQFLEKIIHPSLDFVKKHKIPTEKVLDYGCGPNPALSQILQQQFGIFCQNYDPYFSANRSEEKYSLVFCTEVVEHFRQPQKDWLKLWDAVEVGGVLAVMTQFHQGVASFSKWWYVKDYTHVSFYSKKTFEFLAEKIKMAIHINESPLFIVQK